ncbi:uncharacterized protein LOC107273072 [Cephus cinctus]|uniref:Uncharacterized protein LOC107273072 n=1 Tax=Cephus cinctus TaxID=211228 RepID=A0AAJ7RS76_CEPCN|nr:uncharacterized protein LOC107273072 [Cephus cinctus]
MSSLVWLPDILPKNTFKKLPRYCFLRYTTHRARLVTAMMLCRGAPNGRGFSRSRPKSNGDTRAAIDPPLLRKSRRATTWVRVQVRKCSEKKGKEKQKKHRRVKKNEGGSDEGHDTRRKSSHMDGPWAWISPWARPYEGKWRVGTNQRHSVNTVIGSSQHRGIVSRKAEESKEALSLR